MADHEVDLHAVAASLESTARSHAAAHRWLEQQGDDATAQWELQQARVFARAAENCRMEADARRD